MSLAAWALCIGGLMLTMVLGLGLLGVQDLGPGLARWWGIHLLWAPLGGLAIGAATGWLVVYQRSRHNEAVGLDEFLGLGLVGLAYGVAQVSLASGFLAVFAAGLALQRVRERPSRRAGPALAAAEVRSAMAAPDAHPYPAGDMQDTVQTFNEQLEKLAELALVLMVGAMLAYARPLPALWCFVPLLLLVLRPLSAASAASVPCSTCCSRSVTASRRGSPRHSCR
jgi:NhaP-type Na+/H+ or K+/H+ antiporter